MARDDLLYNDGLVEALRSAVIEGQAGLSDVPGLLKKVLREQAWKRRRISRMGTVQTFERFEQFIATPPLEGLGADLALVKRICDGDPEALDLLDQATVGRQGDHGPHRDIITVSQEPDRGTSEQYALRRLRKSRPDLHARVLAGESSAHAAMLEAGFRQRMLSIPLDPDRAARILAKHFDHDQMMRLLDCLARLMPTE